MALLVADIGGTRARFAIARSGEEGIELSRAAVFAVADHPDLASALRSYARSVEGPLPAAASLALATDITGDVAEMVNSDWVIDRRELIAEFGFEDCLLLNDFEAIAHAVAAAEEQDFAHLFGPRGGFARNGSISVVGPGTGLGVAQLIRADGHYHVVSTEGGHIGFAPRDDFEKQLNDVLSDRHGRVSVERVASGPALADYYKLLAGPDACDAMPDPELWSSAIEGGDEAAAEALDRFVGVLGAVVGDLALAHGSHCVVLVGALAGRLQERLRSATFKDSFVAKGRFAPRMSGIEVLYLLGDHPGLLGAAIAARGCV
ncbi:MAG: ROK family protein [Parasphingopyxis sp.]|nr:ROK family protein [Sphingomonadales bacterium]